MADGRVRMGTKHEIDRLGASPLRDGRKQIGVRPRIEERWTSMADGRVSEFWIASAQCASQ